MAKNEPSGISLLWKTEDWLAVWVGFFIIVLVLAGLTFKPATFKWTTNNEFSSVIAESTPLVSGIEKAADEKGEKALKADAAALSSALASNDRKAINDAAKKMEETVKGVTDAGLKKKAAAVVKTVKGESGNLLSKVFAGNNLKTSLFIGIAFLILSMIALGLMGEKPGRIVAGFPIVFVIAWVSQLIAGNYTILNSLGIEFVLWCLFIGLFISNVIGVPEWLKPAVRTEFYIKSGLVILGANILFGEIIKAGFYGIVQAVLVVSVIWYFTFWVAKKLKVDDDFAAVLSSAVSICGVSAAIAAGGAIKADPKKISYVTSIVLICAIPMMILQPIIARWAGMPDVVAGAWLGGTLDTSGSVVAAGALISEVAMKTGVIVKMSQNVLMGLAAFILAVVWTLKACRTGESKQTPGAGEIWKRFPKFVLGFIIASVIFSFFVAPETVGATKGMLGSLRTWWFALAFTSIGLETKFGDIAKLEGGRPAYAFLIGQGFNIIWTLLLAYLIFGGIIFGVPDIK